jgi:arginase family enzyme
MKLFSSCPLCYVSFDIDGLDPKLCPHTGTPVSGGLEVEQVVYLIKRIIESGRKFIGMDLDEIAIGESNYDANVGARILWKLCNMLVAVIHCLPCIKNRNALRLCSNPEKGKRTQNRFG